MNKDIVIDVSKGKPSTQPISLSGEVKFLEVEHSLSK